MIILYESYGCCHQLCSPVSFACMSPADLLPNIAAKKAGFPIGLYLDAKTNSFVEEFSTSNFLAG